MQGFFLISWNSSINFVKLEQCSTTLCFLLHTRELVHLFCLISIYNCPNPCFCPGLTGNIPASVGSMAAWWNEGKCAVVNDRTPHSLMNSSSLIWVDPHRALTGPDVKHLHQVHNSHLLFKREDLFRMEQTQIHRRKVAALLVHDSWSQCVGVTSPDRMVQIAFGADVFQIRPVV